MARYQKTMKARQYMPGKGRSAAPAPRPAYSSTPGALWRAGT
jgi:hypothetical protein